jgi:hypothetical protein
VSIDEFIIPEMRAFHRQKMVEFIEGDSMAREHTNGFTLNSRGNIVYTKILIQIVPLINEGLRYVIFFRKLMHSKKIFGIRNMDEITYRSESFDVFVENRFRNISLLSYLTL